MVSEMAALLPDEDRRAELLSAHSAAQQAECDLASDAAAAHAMQFGTWQCNRYSAFQARTMHPALGFLQ